MQLDIISLFTDTMFLLVVILLICTLACAKLAVGPSGPKDIPIVKQMRRMLSQIQKEKDVEPPAVKSRQEIITGMFESEMISLGLTPSAAGGHVPVSYTPLSRFLRERNVADEIISAILDGLMEEETEAEVVAIIDAASETPELNLGPKDIEKVRELAVAEWKNLRKKDAS
jgi:hypothetical protein